MAAPGNWNKVYDEDDSVPRRSVVKKIYSFTGNASYATGGDSITEATDIALGTGDTIVGATFHDPTMAYDAVYDQANNKILLFDANTITQVSAAVDTSGTTIMAHFDVLKAAI